MKSLKRSLELFKFNRSSIIFFEIIYKIISAALVTPIMYWILNLSIKAAGIHYLISGTAKKYFRAPTTYLFFALIIFIMLLFVMINISGLIYAMESSYKKEKTNTLEMLVKGFANTIRVFNIKNVKIVLYLLFVLPFVYTTALTGTLFVNKIPEFLNTFVMKHKTATVVILVVYMMLCLVALSKLIAVNYFSLYKINYKQSIEITKSIDKKMIRRISIGVILWNLVFTILFVLFGSALSMAVASFTKKIVTWKRARFVLNMSFEIIFMLIYLVLTIITTPIVYSYVGMRFHEIDANTEYDEYVYIRKKTKKKLTDEQRRYKNILNIIILTTICLLLDMGYIYLTIKGKADLHVLYPTKASITAHRGDSENAPENTMPAFELAYKNGADIIELDVRQTADGQYIIMHDESLRRTTGVSLKVGEASYSYIKRLDAGSTFSESFAGTKIPKLEEVIEFAIENDISLNIEMKTASTDQNYIEGLIDIIHQYDFADKCMIASQKYKELMQVKAIDPEIDTILVMSYALNNLGSMEDVDAFSIRFSSISNELVKDIHRHNKKVYAWTVDDEYMIKRLLLKDVDGIITNDPYNSKKIVYNANNGLIVDLLSRMCEAGW